MNRESIRVGHRLVGSAAARLTFLVPGLVLAACAGGPQTRYYTVSSMAGAATAVANYQGPPIEVRTVQVPPAMDRLEMVRQLAPGQIDVLDFDHWAAPLGRLARQALAEDLARRLPTDKVAIPGAAWPERRAALTVDVLSLRNLDGNSTLTLSWALRPPAPAASDPAAPEPPTRGATWTLQVPASGDPSGTSLAWSALFGQLADRLAAELSR